MASKQTEDSVDYFENDLEKIRAKPNMYSGEMDTEFGAFTPSRECLDNHVDEFLAGRNKFVGYIKGSDGYTYSYDKGEGIPVGVHKKAKISTLEVVLTSIQGGAKMRADGQAYEGGAIGTHGVGLKVLSALSSEFSCFTFRPENGGWHALHFKDGKKLDDVKKCEAPKLPSGEKLRLGTLFKFKLDPKFYPKPVKLTHVVNWAQFTSLLNPGLSIVLTDPKGNEKKFLSTGGVAAYLDKGLEDNKASILGKPIVYHSKNVDLAIAFTDLEGERVSYHTNTVRNEEGGVHQDAFIKALYRSLQAHIKPKEKFTSKDLLDGCFGILNCRIAAPKFHSQVKTKLVDDRVYDPLYAELKAEFDAVFDKNKKMARELCARASSLRDKNDAFLKDKRLIKALSSSSRRSKLPIKLKGSSSSCPVSKRELFVTEGDSATGSAMKARNSSFQEILPLRGKVLNVMRAKSSDKIFASEEVMNILQSIGFDPSAQDPMANLRVGKIVILADSDTDGLHISTLVLGALYKFVPGVFNMGMVYVGKGVEYLIQTKNKNYYGNSLEEIRSLAPKNLHGYILHLKGLGEMDPGPLAHTAFDPATRNLIKIEPAVAKEHSRQFEALMKEDKTARALLLGIPLDDDNQSKA